MSKVCGDYVRIVGKVIRAVPVKTRKSFLFRARFNHQRRATLIRLPNQVNHFISGARKINIPDREQIVELWIIPQHTLHKCAVRTKITLLPGADF